MVGRWTLASLPTGRSNWVLELRVHWLDWEAFKLMSGLVGILLLVMMPAFIGLETSDTAHFNIWKKSWDIDVLSESIIPEKGTNP